MGPPALPVQVLNVLPPRLNSNTTANVFLLGDRFQVPRVDARGIAAQMVEHQTPADLAALQLVGDAVSQANASPPAAEAEHSVAVIVHRRQPRPARRLARCPALKSPAHLVPEPHLELDRARRPGALAEPAVRLGHQVTPPG